MELLFQGIWNCYIFNEYKLSHAASQTEMTLRVIILFDTNRFLHLGYRLNISISKTEYWSIICEIVMRQS